MKTIAISDELHNEIISMKIKEKAKTAEELLKKSLIAYRKQKLHEASEMFRNALAEKGITIEDFLKSSIKIREEIANEWYPD